MKVKEIQHWAEELGLTSMPWVTKEWEAVLGVLSRVLADDLVQRHGNEESDSVTFKISFDAMLQIAEDVLGIPHFIVEGDLSLKFPNIHLALLTYIMSMKQSLVGIDPKVIKESTSPQLIFEADTTAEQLPACSACGQHAFLIERIVVDKRVWHRRCFVCATCSKQLYRGSYRAIDGGRYECVEHFASKILSQKAVNGDDSTVKKRVPPPRPPPPKSNRVSDIIQKQMQAKSPEVSKLANVDEEFKIEELKIDVKPVPLPRSNVPSRKNSSPASSKKEDISDYPGFLNPFGSEEEDDSSSDDDYNEALNPFADEDAEGNIVTHPKLPPSVQPSPQPSIKSNSERPKSQPPPPPKPPRASLVAPMDSGAVSANSQITTLPRAKKTYKAPPPPIPVKRKIEFTENKSYETLEAVVEELKRVQSEHERLEGLGRGIEKDILFTLGREAMDWKKNKRVEEWIGVVEQKCSTIRREAVLIHTWLEKYLNEIHADTEYQLRCVLERCDDGKERSQEDVSREAELLEVLVDIMSLKNGMIESCVDPNSLLDTSITSSKVKNNSKMKKMKTRLKKLKKKL